MITLLVLVALCFAFPRAALGIGVLCVVVLRILFSLAIWVIAIGAAYLVAMELGLF